MTSPVRRALAAAVVTVLLSAPRAPLFAVRAFPPDTTAVLSGRVTVETAGAPAPAARVELVAREGTTLADSLGRFRLAGLEPGTDTLRVSRLDGRAVRRPVRLRAGAVTRVEVTLPARVVDLGGLEVTVEGRRRTDLERLADRIERGVGTYITRGELDRHHGRLSRAFRGILGARVAYVSGGDFRVLLRNHRAGGRGYCAPELYRDGHPQSGLAVDAFDPRDVAVVEVYTADVVPGRFRTLRAMQCGAVLIWTRDFVQ